MAADASFGFVQLEFPFSLGPRDGHFIVRAASDGPPERVLVIGTLGAPERRRMKRKRKDTVVEADAEPVATTRVTIVHPEPFRTRDEAEVWLNGLRDDELEVAEEIRVATAAVNSAVHAHRVAAADPHTRDVIHTQALVTRVGIGSGDDVAAGRFHEAWEVPPAKEAKARRSMESPDERFAAILGGRERASACEELVLRARADVDAGRRSEAALQARVALESLLADAATDQPASARGELESDRYVVGDAANAALKGDVDDETWAGLEAAVERMEAALRRVRLMARS